VSAHWRGCAARKIMTEGVETNTEETNTENKEESIIIQEPILIDPNQKTIRAKKTKLTINT